MSKTRKHGLTTLIASTAAITSLLLAGCASANQSEQEETPRASEAVVSPPAINEEGTLSVCAALGLGAIPLFYFDENQEPQGIEVDLAKEIASGLGLEYREVSTAFPSLVPSLEAAQCDVVMSSLFITEEREAVVDFVPYIESGSVLMGLVGADNGIEDFNETLCGKKVGTPAGTSAVLAIGELNDTCEAGGFPAVVVTEMDSAATGRQMVITGQLDAFAGSSADMYYMVSQSDMELEILGQPFERFVVGAAVRKGNTQLQSAIESALNEMKANGVYEEVLSNVGLESLALEG